MNITKLDNLYMAAQEYLYDDNYRKVHDCLRKINGSDIFCKDFRQCRDTYLKIQMLYNSAKYNLKQKNKITYRCSYCGRKEPLNKMTWIRGEWVCLSCKKYIKVCVKCNTIKRSTEIVNLYEHGKEVDVCYDCYKYIKVYKCKICSKKSITELNKHKMSIDKQNKNSSIVYLCDRCNVIVKCDICEDECSDKLYRHQNNNKPICVKCHERISGLNPYYFKPSVLYFKNYDTEKVGPNTLYFGFEIEVFCKGTSNIDVHHEAKFVKQTFGDTNIYCITDGTINRATNRDGFEIATHPFTWMWYKYNKIIYDDLCLYLRKRDLKANHDNIGFHVHTSKAAWSGVQIYKLLKFVHNNKSFIQKIAQRKANKYCTFTDGQSNVKAAKDKKNINPDHYSIINLNNVDGSGSDTIEFRMFRGTLEPFLVHKNIEFVHACWNYTANYSAMTVKEFKKFISQNKRMYPCLNHFLESLKRRKY